MASDRSRFPLPPGSVIGMLGGGQLGRMMALAAARLGLRLPVPESSPAGHPAAKAQFFWQVFPRNAGGENEQNAIERGKIIDPWSPALYRTSGWHKQ